MDVDSILSSDGSLLDDDVQHATPVRAVRQSSGDRMAARSCGRTARLSFFQRLRQKLSFGSGATESEKAKLVQRTPKKRSLKRQSLITTPTGAATGRDNSSRHRSSGPHTESAGPFSQPPRPECLRVIGGSLSARRRDAAGAARQDDCGGLGGAGAAARGDGVAAS